MTEFWAAPRPSLRRRGSRDLVFGFPHHALSATTMSSRRKSSNDPIDVDFTLRRVFGKTSFRYCGPLKRPTGSPTLTLFRPCQREIITAALEGFDVFVQAGTQIESRVISDSSIDIFNSNFFREESLLPTACRHRPWHHHCCLSPAGPHEQSSRSSTRSQH